MDLDQLSLTDLIVHSCDLSEEIKKRVRADDQLSIAFASAAHDMHIKAEEVAGHALNETWCIDTKQVGPKRSRRGLGRQKGVRWPPIYLKRKRPPVGL